LLVLFVDVRERETICLMYTTTEGRKKDYTTTHFA